MNRPYVREIEQKVKLGIKSINFKDQGLYSRKVLDLARS